MTTNDDSSPPNPLPETLPPSTRFDAQLADSFSEATGTLTLVNGKYHGDTRTTFAPRVGVEFRKAVETPNRKIDPVQIDWAFYRRVLKV